MRRRSTTSVTFTLFPDGTFEYQHDGSETLSDSFTYRDPGRVGRRQ